MHLAELAIENLRCLEKAELEFGLGTNVLFGANGAGKTSVLEAVYLLGRGRSFRTRLNERLVRHGEPRSRVLGRLQSEHRSHRLGVEVRRGGAAKGGTVGRLDGSDVRSLADLALTFPVQAIDPDAHKLIEDSAARRRRWLDWVVFHVEPGFSGFWMRYQRALQQRNAALRAGMGVHAAWDPELVRDGEAMTAARERVALALHPYWSALAAELTGVEITLNFHAGWDRQVSLEESLQAMARRDAERRVTHWGPHRAEVVLQVRGRPAREVLSRGQQKLAAVALQLCQLEYLKTEFGLRPTLLLDDPSAELDQRRLESFLRRIRALDTQTIVAVLDRDTPLLVAPERVFHVEQGRVFRV